MQAYYPVKYSFLETGVKFTQVSESTWQKRGLHWSTILENSSGFITVATRHIVFTLLCFLLRWEREYPKSLLNFVSSKAESEAQADHPNLMIFEIREKITCYLTHFVSSLFNHRNRYVQWHWRDVPSPAWDGPILTRVRGWTTSYWIDEFCQIHTVCSIAFRGWYGLKYNYGIIKNLTDFFLFRCVFMQYLIDHLFAGFEYR